MLCPEGQVLQDDGTCLAPPLPCPSGQILQDDGPCIPLPPSGEIPPLACEEDGIYDLYDADTGELISSGISEFDVPADALIIAADDPRCGLPGVTPPPVAPIPPVDGEIPTVAPTPPVPTGGFPGPPPTGAGPWVPPAPGLPPAMPPTVELPGELPPAVKFPTLRPDGKIPLTTPKGTPIQFRPDGRLTPLVFPCNGWGW